MSPGVRLKMGVGKHSLTDTVMPLLEIYKDKEINASAVQSADSKSWTPHVTVTEMAMKSRLTVPNITKTFPTREAAEQAGLLIGKKWIDDGKPAP